jgi:CubicO group peptidase (beta-lactamase class C family)
MICRRVMTIFIGLGIILTFSLGHAQTSVADRKLLLKQAVTDSLPPKSTHGFTIDLKKDQFVFGEVNQITADVEIRITNPNGEQVAKIDGPARGPEILQFESSEAGTYRVEVSPFQEETGRYSIELFRVEKLAADPAKRVDQLMVAFDNDRVPGAAIAVMRKAKIIFSKAYGMANLTYDIPFRVGTLNNIGSTSKQFTAFAIGLLAKQGKLTLDDDIRKHIPELPDLGKTVTLRHLLTHTSGYREFINLLSLSGLNIAEGDHIRKEQVIEIVQAQPELQNEPGAEFNYNNTGFSLLSTVVERITGEPFPEWMKKNVFEPIGMTSTIVRSHSREIVPNSSLGYLVGEGAVFEEGRDISASAGAGGIYSTVGDLCLWMDNFRTGKVGGKKLIDQMFTRFVKNDGDTTGYGLGLFVDKYKGLDRVHHGGADVAHRSMLMYFPGIGAGVITQSNHAAFPGDMASKVADAFFAKHMTIPEEKKKEASEFDPKDFDPGTFDDFAGKYALEAAPNFTIDFTREEDRFYAQAVNQPKFEIFVTSDSTFEFHVVEASVTFHRDKDNKVETFTLNQNGHHKGRRVKEESWKPTMEQLKEYSGRYYSDELETFYTLAIEDSGLVLENKRMADLKLTPSKEDIFNQGQIINQLVFKRDDDGKVGALIVGNGRTRGVKFIKVPHGSQPDQAR